MQTCIVIPARYGSTRFPGKPLVMVAGKSLLQRVWQIASAVKQVGSVLIATDDSRIVEHAKSFGAAVCLTDPACRNGTERVLEALIKNNSEAELVINLQGDAVLTPPWIIQALLDTLRQDCAVQIATPAVKLDWSQYQRLLDSKRTGQASGTMVVFDRNFNALYFSKAVIPFVRQEKRGMAAPFYRHIGLYGYRRQALERYLQLPAGQFEEAEQLEQLRALENGIAIKVVLVDYRGRTHWSIDSPSDLEQAVSIIEEEGELVE